MQERPAQGIPPDGIQENPAQGPLGNTFLGGKRYPDEAVAAGLPPAPPASPSPSRTFTRVVLPLLLFVGGIAALAWVAQYLPGRTRSGPNPDDRGPKPQLVFAGQKPGEPGVLAEWEPGQKPPAKGEAPRAHYAAEYELPSEAGADGGHYDYEFANPMDEAVEVGVEEINCRCSSVAACALTAEQWAAYQKLKAQEPDPIARSRQNPEDGFPWKPLVRKDHSKSVTVPAKGRGVVRLFWDSRTKKEAKLDLLKAEIWVSFPGKVSDREVFPLGAYVAYVEPVRFHPKDVDVGTLSPQVSEKAGYFYCWSATRRLKVRARPSDPCFAFGVRELDEKGCADLAQELRGKGILTRVRSAYRVDVTVYEQKDGKRLDLGSFQRSVPLEITGNGVELQVAPPVVKGQVQGEVRVAGADEGVINLKHFSRELKKEVTAEIWARQGLELEYEGCEPEWLKLGVKLRKRPEEGGGGEVAWEVRVTVSPGTLEPGALPEGSAIVLRTKGDKRRIRIPVIGTVLR